MSDFPLLEVQHVTVDFAEHAQVHSVIQDLSFQIKEGEILGVVGESGSGKSMTALAVMGLLSPEARIAEGSIQFEGRDLLKMGEGERSRLRGSQLAMIFQEPMTSLNPVMKIGAQVGEPLKLHTKLTKTEIRRKVLEALEDVGLPDAELVYGQYPHELSGGMRQRVMIAQAMICRPRLLIADEPTTALDVVVQAQILRLLQRLHQKYQVSILFISHDLNVIKEICEQVLVMYQGKIVEKGTVSDVLRCPQHAYTKTLVAAIPDNQTEIQRQKSILQLKDLNVFYREKGKGLFGRPIHRRVIRNLNLDVYEGEILGIVGESGCGKSTLAKAIVGLNPDYTGDIQLEPDVRPQMVFQDPFGSLNPAHTIGWILSEPLRVSGVAKSQRRKAVCQMLLDIGLDESYYERRPHELSGGQRQRISIGAALLMKSRLLVADEPVSALDVTVQSQILSWLLELHQKQGMTILMISHDLSLVRHICHRVAVLYQGEIVELADVAELYAHPLHPYTRLLFASAVAEASQKVAEERAPLSESEGLMENQKEGCAYYYRCPNRKDDCLKGDLELTRVGQNHFVRCKNAERT